MLMPPLIAKWNLLKDEDKDLFPLLEVCQPIPCSDQYSHHVHCYVMTFSTLSLKLTAEMTLAFLMQSTHKKHFLSTLSPQVLMFLFVFVAVSEQCGNSTTGWLSALLRTCLPALRVAHRTKPQPKLRKKKLFEKHSPPCTVT